MEEIYKTKMSGTIKIRTYLVIIIFTLLISYFTITLISTTSTTSQFILIGGIVVTLGIIIYYYSTQLKEVHYIKNDKIILKSKLGKKSIPIKDITKVRSIRSSSVAITTGSMGLFGIICNTMDGYKANYSDTNNIYAIETKNEKYLLSSENSQELLELLKTEIANNNLH